jgi:hypothetical protein
LLIVPILKLIKTVLSLLDITTSRKCFLLLYFFLSQYVNELFLLNCGE